MSQIVKVARAAMGSRFEIYLGGDDPAALERLGYDALDRVDWLEQQFSHFLPGSDISRINARAYQGTVSVGAGLFALLRRLRQLSMETEGAFDCTAGRLVRAWGFFRRGQARGEKAALPDPDEIARIGPQIGWQHVELDETRQTVRFLTPYVELHLGAVGKGYAVQCAADFLRGEGVECALLHSGQSSMVAIGGPPESAGWPVGISGPEREEMPLGVVSLRDAALSTSGIAEQSVEIEGRQYSHLFDPRTGQPVAGYHSVSVLSPDAADGDALSTAFFIQGVAWARDYCRTHSAIGALFVPNSPVESDAADPVYVGAFPSLGG